MVSLLIFHGKYWEKVVRKNTGDFEILKELCLNKADLWSGFGGVMTIVIVVDISVDFFIEGGGNCSHEFGTFLLNPSLRFLRIKSRVIKTFAQLHFTHCAENIDNAE